MTLRLDSRQSRQRAALDQLANSTDLRLDVILNLINDELTMPLRMRADKSTPNKRLYIDDIVVTTTDSSSGPAIGTGRNKTIQPISNLLPSFTAGYMEFPSASGGSITASGFSFQSAYTLTVTSGNYIKVMVALNSQGQVVLSFGTEGASAAAATLPVALSGTLALGYVVLQNVGGVIQNVSDSNIYQFAGGGGGGGSGASAKQVTTASPHGFQAGQVVYLNGSSYALARADTAATAEAIGIVSNVITSTIFEVTELGYVSGLGSLSVINAGGVSGSLVAGEVYFLSPSVNGGLTAVEPSVIGQVSKPMFIADSSSSGFVLNYRGATVGSVNARTEVSLTNGGSKQIYTAPTGLEAAELQGWVYINGTTDYRFHLSAQFAQNGAGTDWNLSYQTAGDTPPAGFAMAISSGGVISITLPNGGGFVSAKVNYSINGPAVGTTFPLNVDASTVTTGTLDSARLPIVSDGSANTAVSTLAQSFAGVKTFNDGLKVDNAAGQSTLNYYEVGTHSMTLEAKTSGGTVIATQIRPLYYTRLGNMVTIIIPAITISVGTSTAVVIAASSGTFLPSQLCPTHVSSLSNCIHGIVSASAVSNSPGVCIVRSTGSLEIYRDENSTAWANSGNAGTTRAVVMTYTIST